MKNKYQKGCEKEQELSRIFHGPSGDVIPVLVSALCLRQRDCGQIDLARIEKKEGELVLHMLEVKSCPLVGPVQTLRLRRSGNFLGGLLKASVRISFVTL